jgi:hypothetical protein
MEVDWMMVARALAMRLENHAFCGDHPRVAAKPDNCPFCADRAAYDMWVEAMGKERGT